MAAQIARRVLFQAYNPKVIMHNIDMTLLGKISVHFQCTITEDDYNQQLWILGMVDMASCSEIHGGSGSK